MQELLQSDAQQQQIDQLIYFTNYIDDPTTLEYIYSLGDIFLYPVVPGTTFLEALFHEKPFVLRYDKVWGTAGIDLFDFRGEGAGFMVNNDLDEFCTELRLMLDCNQGDLAQMGIKGRKIVEDKYNWRKIAKECVKHYLSLMSKNLQKGA